MTTSPSSQTPFTRRLVVAGAAALLVVSGVAGCTATPGNATSTAAASTTLSADTLWDASEVHDIALDVDETELQDAIQTYLDSGDKEWVSANVVIDGVSFENVGLKLKGNSSLRGISVDSDPGTLPWIIRLDKYVDEQTWDGWSEFVVRGNSSETSLNEAIALSLLAETDLAAEAAIASSFSVNGGDAALRLIVQNPDEQWTETNFADGTLLYKSESDGTWDYVGDDPADYTDSFDQQAGEDDLTPIVEFMQFLNESDDETFAAELSSRLDVEAFATYLAFQDLVQNSDDIDGPGNNSYLAYNPTSGLMTVVNWDLNLAFGASPGGAGGMGGPGRPGAQGADGDANRAWGGDRPDRARPGGDGTGLTSPEGVPEGGVSEGEFPGGAPEGMGGPGDLGGGQGGMSRGNVLAERFRANDEFAQMFDAAASRLQAELIDSGRAAQILEQWEHTLTDGAGDLVSADTVHSEASQIEDMLGI